MKYMYIFHYGQRSKGSKDILHWDFVYFWPLTKILSYASAYP